MAERYSYSIDHIAAVLSAVKTIAILGASTNPAKPSNYVMRFLADIGFRVYPVNPFTSATDIDGHKVYATLADIEAPIDMVDVFRPSTELAGIAEQAINIGAKVLWAQLDIYDDAAAERAERAGMTVIMDRCPKIEMQRPDWPGV